MHDLASVIIAVAALISAIGSTIAVIMAVRNRRGIKSVRKATNGMAHRLDIATGEAKFLEGIREGESHPRKH